MIHRRHFITLFGGAAATWPMAARAQQAEKVKRVGILLQSVETDAEQQARIGAFENGLQALGWNKGRNVEIDRRWFGSDFDRARQLAAELVARGPDILVVTSPALQAVRQQTRTIPIIFLGVSDPVEAGVVADLARPGGNVTGFTQFEFTQAGKWLELIKEIAPRIDRVLVVGNGNPPARQSNEFFHRIEAAAAILAVKVVLAGASDEPGIKDIVTSFAREPNSGLIVLPGPTANTHRHLLIALSAQLRLPTIYPYRYAVQEGGLIAYGIDNHDLYRRAAGYVDRVLRGENPGDLPVQQPTKFEFVVNLKTAKALGLDVPTSILLRADEVIE